MKYNGGGKKKGLKPYQGDSRCFGEFECPQCERMWQSGNSWADCGQKCVQCDIMVYPFKQRRLDKAEDNKIDLNKPHLSHLCQKCQRLRYDCRERY